MLPHLEAGVRAEPLGIGCEQRSEALGGKERHGGGLRLRLGLVGGRRSAHAGLASRKWIVAGARLEATLCRGRPGRALPVYATLISRLMAWMRLLMRREGRGQFGLIRMTACDCW